MTVAPVVRDEPTSLAATSAARVPEPPDGGCRQHARRIFGEGGRPSGWGRSRRPEQVGQAHGNKALYYSRPSQSGTKAKRDLAVSKINGDEGFAVGAAQSPLIHVRLSDHGESASQRELAATCTYDLLELRRPAAYLGDRKVSGRFSFDSEFGRYGIWFESLAERRWLTDLVWRDQPAFIATQAVSLRWVVDGVTFEHIPDIVVESNDGHRTICDVHGLNSSGDEDPRFLAKARLTSAFCASIGWSYRMGGPLPPQHRLTIETLAGWAEVSTRLADIAKRIENDIEFPRSLNGVSHWAAANSIRVNDAWAALFHLLWWRRLWIDTGAPIRTYSTIRNVPSAVDSRTPWVRSPWRTS